MAEIEIKYAARYTRRKRGNAIGKSLLKTLTEPITNSDDSYRRLENEDGSSSPIVISIDKRNRKVKITDRAEGMGFEELKQKFEYYGADKSGASQGKAVRGLFGQGISDTLLYHEDGTIKTIKDGEASICSFYEKKDKQYINIEKVDDEIEKLSRTWGINTDHGTLIEFTLDEDTRIHEYENLVEKIGAFYMLRFITADDNRLIKLIYFDHRGRKKESIIKYSFPQGNLVQNKEFTFKFEKYPPIKIDVELYRSERPLVTIGDEKENGLLVHDEKNTVYDLTFFGLDNLPNTDRFYGFVKLTGAREIILDKINHKKHPEEVLSDSRDGFNKQHDFYKQLELIMKDWLYPILKEETRKRSDDGVSEAMKQRQQQAFSEINKLYLELAGEETSGTITSTRKERPSGGIEFARNNITITQNKKYNLILSIDTRVIKPGVEVEIVSSKKNVAFSPEKILVEDASDSNDIFLKSISIMGDKANTADTLTATAGKRSSTVVVSIVPEEIYYPENGLSFYPEYSKITPNKDSSLRLYVDLKLIKKDSVVKLSSSNSEIKLRDQQLTVEKPIHGNYKYYIARLDVVVSGSEVGSSSNIEAVCGKYSATARVDVVARHESLPPTHTGKFKDWDFDDAVSSPFQHTYDSNPQSPTYGYILINPNHPINKKYFGDNPKKSQIEKSLHSQLYLAEIILNESLNVIIPEALKSGGLPRRIGNDYDVLYYIAQKKFELGSSIYNLFVEEKMPEVRETKVVKEIGEVGSTELAEGLKGRERSMVELKFGLNEQRPHTLEEIARKYGVTRERVRQIIQRALLRKYQPDKKSAEAQKEAEELLKERDFIREEEEKIQNQQDLIIFTVAKYFGLNNDEIRERTRKANIAIPRQIAIYLIRDIIGLSLPSIGDIFGFDHTTVLYAYGKIKKKIMMDEKLKTKIEEIRLRIEENKIKV